LRRAVGRGEGRRDVRGRRHRHERDRSESTAIYKRLDALRQLHDRARRAGGLGADLAIESAMRIEEGGR